MSAGTSRLPDYADLIVVGGGTAGAAVASRAARDTDRSVLLVEAGPDYGSLREDRWPADLMDARAVPSSHDWGYYSGDGYLDRFLPFQRARVIGGCSSHNGAVQTWGSRVDYDGWARLGLPGWSTDELVPTFRECESRLCVRTHSEADLTPYQRAWLMAGPDAGLPILETINNLDEDTGIAPESVNIREGVRWNTAFAYLDPVRERPNLAIHGDCLVDRLVISGSRARGVVVVDPCDRREILAGEIVISAGTYGSPAILLRSGVGDPAHLREVDIQPTLGLPGVGRNLHDQPFYVVEFSGSRELKRRWAEFAATEWAPDEQVLAKAPSSKASAAFDLHVMPWTPRDDQGRRRWYVAVACLAPKARGRLTLRSSDPDVLPRVDHRLLHDPEGHDLQVLVDGVDIVRELAAQPSLSVLLGTEIRPSSRVRGKELRAAITETIDHYWHPTGTCRMGPDTDPRAVVDHRGRLHGLDNVYVADCSIMPVVPRATTALPGLVVGERVGRWLVERLGAVAAVA